jgi:uncharacterized protein with PIN domain
MKFIVDNNVGRLSGWLRALGYDTLFINPIEDDDLVRIAGREGRVILTRDTGVLQRRLVASGEVPAFFVARDDWREQLAQVVRELGLNTIPQFTRCMACNGLLEPRSREEARAHVPPYVHRTQEEFLYCSACGRHYWKGTHWGRITGELASVSRE